MAHRALHNPHNPHNPPHSRHPRHSTMQYLRYRAATIKRTLGVRVAAAYLRNCGVSLEGAVAILARG